MLALTRAEIDLSAIRHNVRLLCRHVGAGVRLMAVVKANAYGHGAVPVARAALEAGASWLGVASVAEGIALRDAGLRAPILVLGYTPPTLAAEALRHDLSLTVYDVGVAREIGRVARALDRLARVHVKVDTGMHRLGFLPHQVPHALAEIGATPGVHIEGVFTHLSSADSDPEYTLWQVQRFQSATAGANVMLRHVCNSAGTMSYPQAHYDLVRVGIALYGLSPYAPLPPASPLVAHLRPALTLKTVIASVKWLPDGARVGYGGRYRCKGACRIAVIPVGYGDGFRRAPHNFGEVLVRGRRAPVVGNVCMDQSMIDVTHIPDVQLDDEVVLIGRQGDEVITADEIAARLGTINYEVVTALTARPTRVYVDKT